MLIILNDQKIDISTKDLYLSKNIIMDEYEK